jgi:hypothetical protein
MFWTTSQYLLVPHESHFFINEDLCPWKESKPVSNIDHQSNYLTELLGRLDDVVTDCDELSLLGLSLDELNAVLLRLTRLSAQSRGLQFAAIQEAEASAMSVAFGNHILTTHLAKTAHQPVRALGSTSRCLPKPPTSSPGPSGNKSSPTGSTLPTLTAPSLTPLTQRTQTSARGCFGPQCRNSVSERSERHGYEFSGYVQCAKEPGRTIATDGSRVAPGRRQLSRLSREHCHVREGRRRPTRSHVRP